MNVRAWIDNRVAADRRGFVVPAVIFALAIMAMIAMVALRTVDDEKRSSRAVRESAGAFYAADGGLQKTLGNWPSASAKALNAGDSLNLGWQTQTNGSSYRAVIHRVDNGGTQTYAVVVYGRGAGPLGGQAAVVEVVAQGVGTAGIFTRAVFSQGLLTLGGSGSISDSYDHRNGPYNAATANQNGDLFSNGSITLNNGGTIVKGDVAAVGTITGTSGVTGTITPGAAPLPPYPVLSCPAGGYTPASYIPIGGPNGAKSYDPVLGKLIIGSGNNLVLSAPPPGGQYYFNYVDAGGGSITFNTGGHVDMVIDDKLTVGSGGMVNPAADPTLVSVSSCGSPVKPSTWSITGGAGSYFTIYAPNHDVVVGGGGDLWGAVIGAAVSATGGSHFHYDEALGNPTPSTSLTTVAGAWAQFPQ